MVRIGVRVSVGRGGGFLAGKERNNGGATAVGGPSYSVVFGAVGAHLRVILEWRRCYYFGSFTVERERERRRVITAIVFVIEMRVVLLKSGVVRG